MVEPSSATQDKLREYGLIFREAEDGFSIYAEIVPESTPLELLKPIGEDALRFSFLLKSRNSYLSNITALPKYRPGSELFYFNNLRDDQADGRLHLGDSAPGVRVGNGVELVGDTYAYQFSSPVNSASLKIEDIFGNQLHNLTFKYNDSGDTTSEHKIDLQNIDKLVPGCYVISDANDGSGARRFYYDPALFGNSPMGVIEIFSSTHKLTSSGIDWVPNDYRFLVDNELQDIAAYTIQLEARTTTWRYSVIKKYEASGINISNLDDITNFNKALKSDRAVYTSTAEVQLSEHPQKIMLSRNGGTKIRNLPAPYLTTHLQAGASDGSFISDMYVYV